jgi:DNA-binding Lrp family transcriptional regulator
MADMDQAVSRMLDEADVALLDALHTNPRASFEWLGAALGVTAVTAARRCRRLAEQGYLPPELAEVLRSGAIPADAGSGGA